MQLLIHSEERASENPRQAAPQRDRLNAAEEAVQRQARNAAGNNHVGWKRLQLTCGG